MFVFHIGLAKTGTSTLQGTMAANIEPLRSRGILYPIVNDRRRQVAHHVLPQALKSEAGIDSPSWKALRTFRDKARKQTVLVSAEGFSGTNPRLVREGIGGDGARVLVYVRNYPTWAVSAYAQKAKWGSTDLSFDEYLDDSADGRIDRIADHLLSWAEVFGPESVRIRSLDRETLVNGDIVDDFLSALGTTRDGLTIPRNANETPDWRIVELLREHHARHAAETGQSPDETMPARKRAFEAALAAGKRLGWNERAEYLTREQRRRLADQYRSDRQRLMAAIPDCRIAEVDMDIDRDRPFLPLPEAVSAADRRAFEAAFQEAMSGMKGKPSGQGRRGLLGSLQGAMRRVWT